MCTGMSNIISIHLPCQFKGGGVVCFSRSPDGCLGRQEVESRVVHGSTEESAKPTLERSGRGCKQAGASPGKHLEVVFCQPCVCVLPTREGTPRIIIKLMTGILRSKTIGE